MGSVPCFVGTLPSGTEPPFYHLPSPQTEHRTSAPLVPIPTCIGLTMCVLKMLAEFVDRIHQQGFPSALLLAWLLMFFLCL